MNDPRTHGLWLAGERRDAADHEEVVSPFDGEVVGTVALGTAEHLDEAMALATDEFTRSRRMPTHTRAAIAQRCADLIGEHADELAQLMARESGKPIRFARGEVARARVTFTLGADAARRLGGGVMPIDLEERAEGRFCYYTRVPLGPVAAISPFNFPLNLVAHKLSPAIAVGAPVVLKPPPQCPLTSLRLAELLQEAGLPGGMLSVVHCHGETAQRMVEDDRMRVLSFTGSDTVGWKLKSVAGKKRVLLELGGNAPCLVDETAPLDAVLERIGIGAWAHAGQVCIKVQRIVAVDAIYEQLVEAFVRAARVVKVGDPLDPATVVGPVIDGEAKVRILGWVGEAEEGGAIVHCGGAGDGNLIDPIVITDAQPDMRVVKDEVFGPVTVIERVADFDAGLAACNRTRFGLQAGVFTRDVGRALRAVHELDYGGVMINDVPTFRVDNFPYGGMGDSGMGREGVEFAVQDFTETKVAVWSAL